MPNHRHRHVAPPHLRFPHRRVSRLRRRPHLPQLGGFGLVLAVVGPGLLAGLSDDDPAGITTYSVLGATEGYRLLWVIAVSVAALIVYHELGARIGVSTGRGVMALLRQRLGRRTALGGLALLMVANLGTCAAEFAGVATAVAPLGIPPWVAAPVAAAAVGLLVLTGSFHRVEHVLLLLCAGFVTYVGACFLADPDWGAAARGLVIPSAPGSREAWYLTVAAVGTTLAPWGLTFIQSTVVDKGLRREDLRAERIDVITGAVLTGIIGVFVAVSCAATIHAQGGTIEDAGDAAKALEPLAGNAASALFGAGLLGAGLLAAAVVPLASAYSVAETVGADAKLDERWAEAPVFHVAYLAMLVPGALLVAIPGLPLLPVLVGSQALNAVLLLPLIVVMRSMGTDRELMGDTALGPVGRVLTALAIALIAACVIALGLLSVT